jgi:glutamate synthase domain-containing protein 3
MSVADGPAVILVPEVRDYQRINQEVAHLLDTGHRRIRLAEVAGQRLLLSGLKGGWAGTIEVDGTPGPDLASGLDAPGLTILVMGSAGVGTGSGLEAGRLLVMRDVSEAVGAGQRGGLIVVCEAAGHRAGLRQAGGTLVLLGPVGRLAGDRRSGGRLVLDSARTLLPFGRGTVDIPWSDPEGGMCAGSLSAEDRNALTQCLADCGLAASGGHKLAALLRPAPAG